MASRWPRPRASGRIVVERQLDRRRLALVAARFQSPFDGERLAALEAFGRMLDASGATWADLIAGPAEQSPQADLVSEGRNDPPHRIIAETLAREAGDALTAWERQFLRGIARYDRLSDKQRQMLADLQAKAADYGQTA